MKRSSACGLFLAALSFAADAALITGDANNAPHQSDSVILDISADGDCVLFHTGPPASGSTPGITKGGLYVRRISKNKLTLVSDPSVTSGLDGSFSNNARYVTWQDSGKVYWRDTTADETRLITAGADGDSRRPVMSGDGRYVAYASVARNLVTNKSKLQAAGRPGVYRYDSVTKKTSVVSLGQGSVALNTGIGAASAVTAAGGEFDFSADGKFIVFSSDATNVHSGLPDNYPAGFLAVYRRNLITGAVDILNKTSGGAVSDGSFALPRVSADGGRTIFLGTFVGLYNSKRMIESVNNSFGADLFVKDANSGAVWWVTKTTNGAAANGAMNGLALSGNGTTAAFGSTATNLVKGNTDPAPGNTGTFDLFRVDLGKAGKIKKTSWVTQSPNGSGNVDFRFGPFLPGNAAYTAFCTSQVEAMLGTGSNDTIFFQGFSVKKPGATAKPEIVVEVAGTGLVDGTAEVKFGSVKRGATSKAKVFTIKNIGTAPLKALDITKAGARKGDFTVTALPAGELAAGASVTFKVVFKPSALGKCSPTLRIASNDANENPFDITLKGTGIKP